MDDISKKIIENFIGFLSLTANSSTYPDAGTKTFDTSLLYFSGCDFPFFNGIFNPLKQMQHLDAAYFSSVTQFFSAKNKPFIWWFTEKHPIPPTIQTILNKQHFQFLGEFSGIAVELNKIIFNIADVDSDVTIKIITTDHDFEQSISIICESFQLSDGVKTCFRTMFNSYGEHGKLKHYLGFYKGEALATLSTYMQDSVVGLYNGVTLERGRKKGLCSQLILQAMTDAKIAGGEYAVAQLMSSGMAKGLTEKMGFKPYCSLMPFLKEHATNS